jgi:hypothetical protein
MDVSQMTPLQALNALAEIQLLVADEKQTP